MRSNLFPTRNELYPHLAGGKHIGSGARKCKITARAKKIKSQEELRDFVTTFAEEEIIYGDMSVTTSQKIALQEMCYVRQPADHLEIWRGWINAVAVELGVPLKV